MLPVASLRALLGQTESDAPSSARAIVLGGAAPVALTVDAVEALVSLDAGRIETRQKELTAADGELLRGAFQPSADQEVAKILDIQALLAAAFVQRARAKRVASVSAARGADREADEADIVHQMMVTFEVAGQESPSISTRFRKSCRRPTR